MLLWRASEPAECRGPQICPTQHCQSYFPHRLRNSTDMSLMRELTAGARDGGREGGMEELRNLVTPA